MRENCVLRLAWLPILEIPILPPLFDNGIKLLERRQPLPWKVPVCPDPSGQTRHCPMAVTVASGPASITYEISGYSSEEPNFPHALAASCHLGNRLPPALPRRPHATASFRKIRPRATPSRTARHRGSRDGVDWGCVPAPPACGCPGGDEHRFRRLPHRAVPRQPNAAMARKLHASPPSLPHCVRSRSTDSSRILSPPR